MITKTNVLAATSAAALAVVLAGCSGTPSVSDNEAHGTNTPAATSTPATSTESPSGSPATEADPAGVADAAEAEAAAGDAPSAEAAGEAMPSADEVGPGTFGQTAEWDGGLKLRISKPKPFEPSEWAAGLVKGADYVTFNVTIINDTGKTFDPSMFTATVQSGNTEASEVFDEGLEGAPMTKLLDGREAKFKIGFAVADAKDLVLEASPDFMSEPVIFTNTTS